MPPRKLSPRLPDRDWSQMRETAARQPPRFEAQARAAGCQVLSQENLTTTPPVERPRLERQSHGPGGRNLSTTLPRRARASCWFHDLWRFHHVVKTRLPGGKLTVLRRGRYPDGGELAEVRCVFDPSNRRPMPMELQSLRNLRLCLRKSPQLEALRIPLLAPRMAPRIP